MNKTLLLLFASGGLLFVGCSTSYQAKGLTGGYSDVRLDANIFRVEFQGNAYTSRQTVETYVLRRCAELTAQAGYDYFVAVGSNTEARQGAYTTPGSYNSTTTGYATAYGNTAYGSATTTGTFSPGQTFIFTKYGASAMIKVFKGDKPMDNPNAYNAREILRYLGSPTTATDSQQLIEQKSEPQTDSPKPQRISQVNESELQAAIQRKPELVKRYAMLRHTKGSTLTIPPQTLQAEYMDTGEGHGPARVIYPNNDVLDGEYRTIASGENFKGLVNARLIDPNKVANFPNSNLRGFASFTGSDGTFMECAYAVTGPSGNGRGSCIDNRGNQYELSF